MNWFFHQDSIFAVKWKTKMVQKIEILWTFLLIPFSYFKSSFSNFMMLILDPFYVFFWMVLTLKVNSKLELPAKTHIEKIDPEFDLTFF